MHSFISPSSPSLDRLCTMIMPMKWQAKRHQFEKAAAWFFIIKPPWTLHISTHSSANFICLVFFFRFSLGKAPLRSNFPSALEAKGLLINTVVLNITARNNNSSDTKALQFVRRQKPETLVTYYHSSREYKKVPSGSRNWGRFLWFLSMFSKQHLPHQQQMFIYYVCIPCLSKEPRASQGTREVGDAESTH